MGMQLFHRLACWGYKESQHTGVCLPDAPRSTVMLLQVVFTAWMVATIWFVITWASPCQPLPSKEQLEYYESSGEDQDIYAGVSGYDSRGLKFFPQLW